MKGIEKLSFLTPENKNRLFTSERLYRQHARIEFEVLNFDDTSNEVIIKVWQNENVMERYLEPKELISRTKEVFDIVPEGTRVHVHPVAYIKKRLKTYNVQDILKDMDELGLQQKDLVKLLDIDKSNINRLLNGGRELTKYQKAMFYYTFEYLKMKK
ncbi:hypothetical protein [Bacteroides sp. 519]|uniref:hypothetical protein n=1 Tax=Bacteroides sp. 519 TaxID=2302937 RepID=UPI0013D20A86|nr:hypothetical protein [Bacteroides sp. 519]NDV56937.1 hypothetical protein [Bacteroides sp. 519]